MPLAALWVVALGFASLPCPAESVETESHFRVGFSKAMFSDVNENDAKAALKVWGLSIAKAQDIPTQPNAFIFDGLTPLLKSLEAREVDAVGISLSEFDQISRSVRFDPVFVTQVAGRKTEQYLLLSHQESLVKCPADLQGRSLRFQNNIRASLASTWLDVLLLQQGHPPSTVFAGKVSQDTKLTKVVLPVFFRQSDACVVTRSGFETMKELNPQVGKQLKAIAASPELVPAVLAFRADYAPPFKGKLISGLNDLHKTPVGQQVLTIFQSDRIEQQPSASLDSTLELLATCARLRGGGPVPSLVASNPPARGQEEPK